LTEETEHERRVREYWSRVYDDLIKNKDKEDYNSKLQYQPTAVLTHQARKPIKLRDILDIDFSR